MTDEEYVPQMAEYVVQGPQDVHETAPGETVRLDANAPETGRLLERGQIVKNKPVKSDKE